MRENRRTVIGKVASAKMQKTVVVTVQRLELHPKYKKYVRKRTKLYAHDERAECSEGDRVQLIETRPMSRLKRWRVVKKL
jgi:small subunit ribosomal protein S17